MKLTGDKLACQRGGRLVFEEVSFSVAAGELLILKGRNGAGKTSLLRVIAGLNGNVDGQLTLQGGHGDLTIAQQCHFIAHQDAVKPALSVSENLAFWSGFSGGGDVPAALAAFDLTDLAPFSATLLSAGQKRRLALSRLVSVARPLWLLDEPTVGLDAASVKNVNQIMSAHLHAGGLIIATTHIDIGIKPARVFDFDTHEVEA